MDGSNGEKGTSVSRPGIGLISHSQKGREADLAFPIFDLLPYKQLNFSKVIYIVRN